MSGESSEIERSSRLSKKHKSGYVSKMVICASMSVLLDNLWISNENVLRTL